MAIIIPMAGMSNRFLKAGFSLPKYMLYVGQKSVFRLSIESFNKYFNKELIIFICRNIYNTVEFIESECKIVGLNFYKIVVLDTITRGQAETVSIGISKLNLPSSTPLTIFNIDTFRKNYTKPENIEKYDGYLEVFEGQGSNWSYVKENINELNLVLETTEKNPISNLCSDGLYYFKTIEIFEKTYNIALSNQLKDSSELYIAPLYNHLIEDGYKIYYHKIDIKDELIFCGTPVEYLEQVHQFTIHD